MLLRGLAKLVAVVVVAAGVGIALGIAFAKLSDDGDPPTSAGGTATTVDGSTAGVARSTSTDRSSQPDARDPLGQVRVRVLDGAVLRLAGTRSELYPDVVDGLEKKAAYLPGC
ncbi:MAG: hypothetical protein M3R46_12595 [Actinomycetota bacterium]|nr:hypothetical protein [Actinomycetota bacterium]